MLHDKFRNVEASHPLLLFFLFPRRSMGPAAWPSAAAQRASRCVMLCSRVASHGVGASGSVESHGRRDVGCGACGDPWSGEGAATTPELARVARMAMHRAGNARGWRKKPRVAWVRRRQTVGTRRWEGWGRERKWERYGLRWIQRP